MHFLNGSNFRPRFNGKMRERIQPSENVYTFSMRHKNYCIVVPSTTSNLSVTYHSI